MRFPTKLRIVIILLLALTPVGFLCAVGSYHLWDRGWSFTAYWPMALCWLTAYGLGWYWTRRRPTQEVIQEPLPGYWTERDKQAWSVVESYSGKITEISADQVGDLKKYAGDAQNLALEITRIYKPGATDPFSHLTLPEILACGELVAHDLTDLVNKYVPGSHLLNVSDLRRLRNTVETATEWYPRLRMLYWAASAIFDPVRTGMQVVAAKAGLGPAFQGFQQNIQLWFYTSYIQELGRYLIELNSGRLKVGAKRYQELLALHQTPEVVQEAPPATETEPSSHPKNATSEAAPQAERPTQEASPKSLPITIAIVGPVKSGKSSLVNALLGEQQAGTDVTPLTAGITRYSLRRPGQAAFTLLDTAGFGNEGASEMDVQAAVEAARQADVLLLVAPARSAARKPESEFLDRVRGTLMATPHLKVPPTFLVLSKIDLLSPAMEWAPPYQWHSGNRLKEVQIREAVEAAREVFQSRVMEVIPTCTASGKEHGVFEELLPAVANSLGEARGVSLLRMLHTEASAEKMKRVFGQIGNAASQIFKAWWDSPMK